MAKIIKVATRGYVADPRARARLEGIAAEDGTPVSKLVTIAIREFMSSNDA